MGGMIFLSPNSKDLTWRSSMGAVTRPSLDRKITFCKQYDENNLYPNSRSLTHRLSIDHAVQRNLTGAKTGAMTRMKLLQQFLTGTFPNCDSGREVTDVIINGITLIRRLYG